MYISYSSSDEYCEYTGISMISLFENNKNLDLNIFLIDNGISLDNQKNILQIAKTYNREIVFVDGKKIIVELKNRVPEFNGSFSTYSRIILDKIYPDYVDKILVLDSDTVINGSIIELYKLDVSNKIIAAVENPEFYMNNYLNNEEKDIIKEKQFYFNAGIMLVNLKEWRNKNFSNCINQAISTLRQFEFVDQTILNKALPQNEYIRLPYKYNYCGHLWNEKERKNKHAFFSKFFSETEIEEAERNPIIIHYKGYTSRPWFKESDSSLQNLYLYYKSISPWKNTKLKSIFNSSYYKNLCVFDRIKLKLSIKFKDTYFLRFLKGLYKKIQHY